MVLVVVVAALLAWQRPWQSDSTDDAAVPADAAARLTSQFAALSRATDQDDFARAAGDGPAASRFARAAWSARATLGVGDVRFRYLSGGDRVELGDGDTRARVEVTWSGAADGSADVQVRLRPRPGGTFDVVSVDRGTGALPVWLAGAVTVQRSDGTTVVRVDGGDDDLDVESLAARAREAVDTIVPGSDRGLTVVSAPSAEVAGALLGQGPQAVRQIAAVSTGFDDRNGQLAGPAVVLNPQVFDAMDGRAAQVVMTHEATHVLTGAIGSSTPDTWVVEGFADFVALHDDTASLAVSAGQTLAGVRADGPPANLPTGADFDESSYLLGSAYEAAWLAFRMLAEQRDDAAVIAFYRSVLAGESVDRAGRAALGLDTRQITARWRDYLTKSASTVS